MQYNGLVFRQGMRWKDVSASGLQSLVETVQSLAGRLDLLQNRIAQKETRSRARQTVLIVEQPASDSRTMRVRRVRYKTRPPVPCDADQCYYELAGPIFDAYPWIGSDVADYDVFDGETIKIDSPFYEAVFEDDTWRLQKPGADANNESSAIRFGLVQSAFGPFLSLQPIAYNEDTGQWALDGDEVDVDTVPFHDASAFALHVSQAAFGEIGTGIAVPFASIGGRLVALSQGFVFDMAQQAFPLSACA